MDVNISALAASYAARGWKIVKLYGLNPKGGCSCRKGRDCPTPGKHPFGENWDQRATSDEDEIASWFEGGGHWNIGLLLGPRSGIVDVELDGEDAKRAWDQLGLGELWTPTYTAGRGPHRLFKWDERLPPLTVGKPMGIEVRIGQGGKMIQSVLPPSTHHSGVRYKWVPGMSPDEVEPMALPEELVRLLWNDDGTSISTAAKKPANAVLHDGVKEGDRNNTLHRFAVRSAFRCLNIEDPQEQMDLLVTLRAVNKEKCRPPLDDDEVVSLYQNAITYVRKCDAAGIDAPTAIAQAELEVDDKKTKKAARAEREKNATKTFTESGLSFSVPRGHVDPEWGPGNWHLTVVHSDPLEYRLMVPAWRRFTANGTGYITLTVDQYRSATKVAAAVLAATGVIMLDAEPGRWKKIWDGGYKVTEPGSGKENGRKRPARGVKAKLLDNVTHEYPGASSLRYVILASWLYDRLAQASQPTEDDTPDSTGRAAWRKDGTLWFGWARVWEDIERQHRVLEGERLSLKRRLLSLFGVAEFVHAEHKHVGGIRRSYVVWSRQEFATLERLATEVDPMPADPPAPAGNPLGFVAGGQDGEPGGGAILGALEGDRPGEGVLEGPSGGRNSGE